MNSHSFSTPFIFLFLPFWEADIKDYDIQKQLHITDMLESDHACPGKGVGLENT